MLISRNRIEPGFKEQHEYIFYWNIYRTAFLCPLSSAWAEPISRILRILAGNLHQRLRSRGVQPSLSVLLICLTVICSLNHGVATDISDRPWALLGVQTVMGISIDIGLKGSVSRLFTLWVPWFPIHTTQTLPLSSESPLISKKIQGAALLNAHKILISPFHKRGRTHSIWWANCVWHN